jgi:hypothetical protein
MNTRRKVALTFATIIGVGIVGYLGWRLWKKSRTSSGNPTKDNRNIQIVRV